MLKVDARPAKQALSTWVTKWMFAYTQHLQDTVLGCLTEPLTLTLTLTLTVTVTLTLTRCSAA